MNNYTLTLLDTSAIQDYIFRSNDLKQIVGASHLVHQTSHDWVCEALRKLGKTNVLDNCAFEADLRIESDRLVSELVFAGGGNTLILFRHADDARLFTRGLTNKILNEAPGLNIVIVHQAFDWDDREKPLIDVYQKLLRTAEKKKDSRAGSSYQLGLSVTADCQYTGQPAVGFDQDRRRISREVRAKLDAFEPARNRLKREIPADYRNDLDFEEDFGRYGEEGSSYIAVIHTDGNGMGKRIQAITDNAENRDNRRLIEELRAFSESINKAALEALCDTVLQMTKTSKDGKIGGVVAIKKGKLPFRPIIFGGDDSSFVCDGRLGLSLTHYYLTCLGKYDLHDHKPISGRAGVAVVKSHFPFARAYALAEELAASAKEYRYELISHGEEDPVVMDWHFSTSGVIRELDDLRSRDYTIGEHSLLMRPIHLNHVSKSNENAWRSWDNFYQGIQKISGLRGTRSKAMGLLENLRQGGKAVENYVVLNRLCKRHLPGIPGDSNVERSGWVGKRCFWHDLLEAHEYFIDLGTK